MENSSQNQWIVKTSTGEIFGPYSTRKVLKKIRDGVFTGNELISKYPGGTWISITNDPEFYDKLLDVLAGVSSGDEAQTKNLDEQFALFETNEEFEDGDETLLNEELQTPDDSVALLFGEEPDEFQETIKLHREKKEQPEDIVLEQGPEKMESVTWKERLSQRKVPVIVLAGIFIMVSVYFLFPGGSGGRIRLKPIVISKDIKPITADVIKTQTQAALEAYLSHTLTGYEVSQANLVRLIERDPKNLNLYGVLCLSYLELWPYSYQDSEDLKTIKKAVQLSSKVNPTHIYSFTCKGVEYLVRGKYQDAKVLSEQALDNYGSGDGPAPIPFYYFKAKTLEIERDFETAVGYINSARRLWPDWIAMYIFEAQILLKLQRVSEAYKVLSEAYQRNKNVPATKVLIGVIEQQHFNKFERAKTFLNSGLKNPTQMSRRLASQGFLSLANIYLSEGESSKALRFAQKAYAFNFSNQSAKNMILRLDGKVEPGNSKAKAYQFMLDGDHYVRSGDCQSGQAHYKSAFEIDKKLAIAAYKAGECLWSLSFTTEAIDWVKRAIKADPKYIDAYVLLADYYSQRYDFLAAARTLGSAQKANPKGHEVLRGYALIELRRNSPESAVSFAKQALLIYENDIGSLVILAKAYLKMPDKVQEAFAAASKALELDASHQQSQLVYAKTLSKMQGIDFGISYLTKLIRTYPTAYIYRLELGKLYASDERYGDAEAILREVISIREKPKAELVELGKVLSIMGQYQSSVEAFFQAAVLDPSDVEPFYQAGKVFLKLGQPNKAKEQLNRVLKINSKFPLIHYQIGKVELRLNNPKAALDQARMEKQNNPNLAAAHILAAEAHTMLKQYDLCASEYQRAIKISPQDVDTYIKIAQCYRLSGSFDSAISMLNSASRVDSGNPKLYKEQGAIFEAKGDIQRAVQAYKEYFALDPNAPDRAQIEKRIQSFR